MHNQFFVDLLSNFNNFFFFLPSFFFCVELIWILLTVIARCVCVFHAHWGVLNKRIIKGLQVCIILLERSSGKG